MTYLILKAILLLALPVVVLVSGALLMGKLVGREYLMQQLHQKADAKDQKSLNQRITGYDLAEVSRQWGALDNQSRTIERHYLELDLVFPLLYGAALASALLLAWAVLGRPFHPVWLILPVGTAVFSDWTENLVQLSQLQLYVEKGMSGLQAGCIQIASAATIVKLVSIFGASLLLVWLTVWMVVHAVHPSS
jgi:hypothetical protein